MTGGRDHGLDARGRLLHIKRFRILKGGVIGHDRSGSGRWLSRRATAGIAYLLACCGGLMLERAGADARATAAAASRPGASMVTTLMMVPVVCALTMLADLRHAAWLAPRRLPGPGLGLLARDRDDNVGGWVVRTCLV